MNIGGDNRLTGGSEGHKKELTLAQFIASVFVKLALMAVRWLGATLEPVDIVVPDRICGVAERQWMRAFNSTEFHKPLSQPAR